MAEMQMTEDNRPYIEALSRIAAGAALGMRDHAAEQLILNVIEELVDRRRKTALAVKLLLEVVREYREMKRDASAPNRALEALIGLDSAERQVWELDQQIGEERRQARIKKREEEEPEAKVIIVGTEALDENGNHYPIIIRESRERKGGGDGA